MKAKLILITAIILTLFGTFFLYDKRAEKIKEQEEINARLETLVPLESEMVNIAKLSTIECTYHNVAKYEAKDAENWLWFSKDKRFWIEYDAKVEVGIDATLLDIEIKDKKVIITMPPAEIIKCTLDNGSITDDSFYVDKNSAKITALDESHAIADAQVSLNKEVASDPVVLDSALRQAKTLLEDYVSNISTASGIKYEIEWNYIE